MLSPFWQKISYLNPILYMVNAFRYGMLGTSDVPVTLSLILIVLSNVVLYLLAWRFIEKGVGLKV
jgi:ABC-2 type transport system permease protein